MLHSKQNVLHLYGVIWQLKKENRIMKENKLAKENVVGEDNW